MSENKICVMCGRPFEACHGNQKTCSVECSLEMRKQYHDKWIADHPGYMQSYFIENRERYSRAARKARKEAKEEPSMIG